MKHCDLKKWNEFINYVIFILLLIITYVLNIFNVLWKWFVLFASLVIILHFNFKFITIKNDLKTINISNIFIIITFYIFFNSQRCQLIYKCNYNKFDYIFLIVKKLKIINYTKIY